MILPIPPLKQLSILLTILSLSPYSTFSAPSEPRDTLDYDLSQSHLPDSLFHSLQLSLKDLDWNADVESFFPINAVEKMKLELRDIDVDFDEEELNLGSKEDKQKDKKINRVFHKRDLETYTQSILNDETDSITNNADEDEEIDQETREELFSNRDWNDDFSDDSDVEMDLRLLPRTKPNPFDKLRRPESFPIDIDEFDKSDDTDDDDNNWSSSSSSSTTSSSDVSYQNASLVGDTKRIQIPFIDPESNRNAFTRTKAMFSTIWNWIKTKLHFPLLSSSSSRQNATTTPSPRRNLPHFTTKDIHNKNRDIYSFFNISNCPNLPPRTDSGPKSIHDLRPDDIKVILAMGDSVMTGFGTRLNSVSELFRNFTNPLLEYRGTSFSMGADDDVVTLANLFKRYNPDVKGASKGEHVWSVCWGPICKGTLRPEIDNLNAAQSGAMVMNLRWQLDYLTKQIRHLSTTKQIDALNDYKYLTLWAGNNDLCLACTQWTVNMAFHPDIFELRMRKVIELIRHKIPKTIVNIMGMVNITQTWEIATSYPKRCFHARNFIYPFACPCAAISGKTGDALRTKMNELAAKYNERLIRIVRDYSKRKDDDFAVIYDPGLSGLDLTRSEQPGMLVSPLDCFHPSLMAHQLIAASAWNNLFLDDGEKKHYTTVKNDPLLCPDKDTRIRTQFSKRRVIIET